MKCATDTAHSPKSAQRVRRRLHLLASLDTLFQDEIQPLGYADLTDYVQAKIRADVGLHAAQSGPRHG